MMRSVIRYALLVVLLPFMIYLWFFYAPPVEFLGNSIRILFFHVPAAWVSVISFFLSLFFSLKYIRSGKADAADAAAAVSAAGLMLLVTAAVTGSVWAAIAWKSWWNWDVRQTSIAVLIFIYAAYFSIRVSVSNRRSRDMISSVYLIFAALTVPLFIFIMPRLYESLHPDLFRKGASGLDLNSRVIRVLAASLIFFTWLYMEIFLACLLRKKHEN